MIENSYKKLFPVQEQKAILTHILKAVTLLPKDRVNVKTELVTAEYNSVCPWSGLPDFAKLSISYTPKDTIIEMKSLKLYITSYRDVGITMEDACGRICREIGLLLNPTTLTVSMEFTSRGGWSNIVTATWEPNLPENSNSPNIPIY